MNKCFSCETNIAKMDISTKKCSLCNHEKGWVTNQNGLCECTKGKFVDSTLQCKTCGDIIRGCEECEPAEAENVDFTTDLAVNLGKSQAIVTSYPESMKYLKCKKAGANLFTKEVTVTNADGQTTKKLVIEECTGVFPGCSKCNEDVTKCIECKTGMYLWMQNG